MRTHVTPFVADHEDAQRALISDAESDLVVLATSHMGDRRPGTPRWPALSSDLPRGEEAWMNAEAEFEEAIRARRENESRQELALERRKEVEEDVAEALSSARRLMRFKVTRLLFWEREEPFRVRVAEYGIDVWYGDDKIELRNLRDDFTISVNGYSQDSFSMSRRRTPDVAQSIARAIIRHLARTAIPQRNP